MILHLAVSPKALATLATAKIVLSSMRGEVLLIADRVGGALATELALVWESSAVTVDVPNQVAFVGEHAWALWTGPGSNLEK